MYTRVLAEGCKEKLNLESATFSSSCYYDSLPLCVIDAVFSIGVQYTAVKNVVRNYCSYYELRRYNREQDSQGDTHTISQLVEHITDMGIQKSADIIFKNHQRTSARNGILKAEAVLQFAKVLQRNGIESIMDFRSKGLSENAVKEILKIPGQKSGLSLRYFCMLAGDDTQAKPDRHVLRFINQITGKNFSVQQAYEMLSGAADLLKPVYPHLTVRLLDYTIWNYMAHGEKTDDSRKKYYKLVRDRIPEIIHTSGRSCLWDVLSHEEYIRKLDEKLNEELEEYQESKSLEELADLLEVIQAVVKARGWTLTQLEQVKKEKAEERGRFEKRILLREVKEK